MIENLPKGEVFPLKTMLMVSPDQVLSKTFAQQNDFTMKMCSLWCDRRVSLEACDQDLFLTCLEGTLMVTLSEKEVYIIRIGESLVLEANKACTLIAKESCKFMLIRTK